MRSAVELAKDWRTDKILRRLEALLAVADKRSSLILSGNGDVIEPEEDIIAIGSGGLMGKGFEMGSQSHLGYLPVFWTDFIFASFA